MQSPSGRPCTKRRFSRLTPLAGTPATSWRVEQGGHQNPSSPVSPNATNPPATSPNRRILEHPVRFGTNDAEWTAVTSWLEGTFTQPMFLADGTSIPPTGKAFRILMVTIGHWNEDGVMNEEYLFWDNAEFYRQLGLSN